MNSFKKTVCEDDTDSDSEKFSFQVDKSVKRFWSTVLLPLNGLTNDINKCTFVCLLANASIVCRLAHLVLLDFVVHEFLSDSIINQYL